MDESQSFPEETMICRLAGRTCVGTFESHITISATDELSHERFRETCCEIGVKAVLIELPTGRSPTQLMTGAYHRGNVQQASADVASMVRRLRAAGFAVTRVKLEAIATNEDLPESDAEAIAQPGGCYFEFHLKLNLAASADLATLTAICEDYDARLSRNAFKVQQNGRCERFVNMRLYRVGRTTAFQRFEALKQTLQGAGFEVLNQQREYAVFDSDAALDAGWLDHPPDEPEEA
jgi:hypothetical protein